MQLQQAHLFQLVQNVQHTRNAPTARLEIGSQTVLTWIVSKWRYLVEEMGELGANVELGDFEEAGEAELPRQVHHLPDAQEGQQIDFSLMIVRRNK